MNPLIPDLEMIRLGWYGLCPKCREGRIFKPGWLTVDLKDACPACGLDLSKSDSADGPAVFLIFILGFALVPLALWVVATVPWPLWLHAAVWAVIALTVTLGWLRPLKAYIIALQYKHRPHDWDDD